MIESRMPVRIARAALCLIAGTMLLCRCAGGSGDAPGGKTRELRLTSEHTEIVISSSKVPGYWAKQTSDGEVFFLSTSDGTYGPGDTVKVKGPYGHTMASVFDEETRAYQKYRPTHILIVWKMNRAAPREDTEPAPERTQSR